MQTLPLLGSYLLLRCLLCSSKHEVAPCSCSPLCVPLQQAPQDAFCVPALVRRFGGPPRSSSVCHGAVASMIAAVLVVPLPSVRRRWPSLFLLRGARAAALPPFSLPRARTADPLRHGRPPTSSPGTRRCRGTRFGVAGLDPRQGRRARLFDGPWRAS